MRFFNTEGPVRPDDHYAIPPLGRGNKKEDILAAREALILSRRTHLAQLVRELKEERVRRVVEPMLSGGLAQYRAGDLEYVRELGLITSDSPPRITNPIYQEVVPRALGQVTASTL